MTEPFDRRGVLYPTKLPTFERIEVSDELSDLVRWFWIPQWDIAPGRVSRQTLLPFPTSNLVVAHDGVTLAGPSTRISHRDLAGQGWAVGALLRPAASGALGVRPASLIDQVVSFDAPELGDEVASAMRLTTVGNRRLASRAFTNWIQRTAAQVTDSGLLANQMEDLISADRNITRVDQLAGQLNLTVRSVQRLATRYVGLPPLAMIRRYRLQEAAQRVRDDRSVTVGQIAAELGYSDHAHLDADFRQALGFTPASYRRSS